MGIPDAPYNGYMKRPSPRPRGLTLTETVTALALLGIGVLCIATVYLERSQAAPAVLLHSKANRLAEELAEQIAARRGEQAHFENPVGVVCKPALTEGTPQALATNDVACWQDKIAATLPNGSGAIALEETAGGRAYLITVSWSPPDGGTASYLLRTVLPEAKLSSSAPPAARAAN